MALRIWSKRYDEQELALWLTGNHDMLTAAGSHASKFIRKILEREVAERAKGGLSRATRPDRRFFGEALIASKIPQRRGWYGSNKWLTADRWRNGDVPVDKFQRKFKRALQKSFKKDLAAIHQAAKRLRPLLPRNPSGRRRKPVAPGLWLIDRRGNHRFIEVKLPADHLRPAQLAGLAVLAFCFARRPDVSIEIANLYSAVPRSACAAERKSFNKFYQALRRKQVQDHRLALSAQRAP